MRFLFALLALLALGDRPHILLIMADDVGIEGLGCYGGESYATPHLDALAAGGMRFTHAYSQPLCTPTRLQIMTGKYNHRNWQYFGILPKGEKTFAHLMRAQGYRSLLAGKWQLTSYDPPDFPNAAKRRGTGTHPRDAGFDEYILFHAEETEDKGSRYANPTWLENGTLHKDVAGKYGEDVTVDYILSFWERHQVADKPMFVYYPMALPHGPFVPTPDSADWADPAKRLQVSTTYFTDMVEYMDTLVGRLVAGLDRLSLRDDTIVIFYSDNGTHKSITARLNGQLVTGGKASPKQTGIRVPLIVNCPGRVQVGHSRDLVDASDFLPTLMDLAGGKIPADWDADGLSFAPTLLGKAGPKRDAVFIWYDPRPGWGKEPFSRHIFALDHDYKCFSDGRLFAIDGLGMKEELVLAESAETKAARSKLLAAIETEMKGGQPPEVDAFGNPITE